MSTKSIKRISVNFSDAERAELDNNKYKYSVSRIIEDTYELLFAFKKYDRQTDLTLTITNIKKKYTIPNFYSGIKCFNYYYFLDKVIDIDLGDNEPKLLIKLNAYENEKERFKDSIYISKLIDKFGDIHLDGHVAYANFYDTTELIELCLKYAQCCKKYKDERSREIIENLLDKTLIEVETDFQNKLEYYGYNIEVEINNLYDIKNIVNNKVETIQEIKDKIILLTQLLFRADKCKDGSCYYLVNGIIDESNNYFALM